MKPGMTELHPTLLNVWKAFSLTDSYLPVGIMISDRNGDVFYRNGIFEKWLPDFPINNQLWFMQMQPFLENESDSVKSDCFNSLDCYLINSQENTTDVTISWQNHKHYFNISRYSITDELSNILGFVEITENNTSYKFLENLLNQSRRFETVGRLASGIAHDFNNILQVINGHSEILLETYKKDHKLNRSLDIILTSGQKASALTRQLLIFSRRQKNEFKKLNLGFIVKNMHKLLDRMLGEDICMTIDYRDEKEMIEGDESQIEQIIMNLAVNARDAISTSGKISMTIEISTTLPDKIISSSITHAEKYVKMTFSDNGCGMSQEVVEHIFEPFFTTKEFSSGTGLGLATVYSIVKQHQGFIQVESQPGKGTSFYLYFPVAGSVPIEDIEELWEKASHGSQEKVLIIEDDDLVRDLATQVLVTNGYCVQSTSNLTQAHKILENERFDLFLIDIVLPDGNGVDFVEHVKLIQPHASFILSSGYTEDKPQIKQTISKGYTFLHKPYTINALLSACRDALIKTN